MYTVIYIYIYTVVMPKWLIKKRGSAYFRELRLFPQNTPTSHTVQPYLCTHAAILHCRNSKWFMHSFVTPSCTVVLLWCFLLNITTSYYGIKKLSPLQQLRSKKGGRHIFKGGPIFERLRYVCLCVAFEFMPLYGKAQRCPYFYWQVKLLLKVCGLIHILKLESTECGKVQSNPNLVICLVHQTIIRGHHRQVQVHCYTDQIIDLPCW